MRRQVRLGEIFAKNKSYKIYRIYKEFLKLDNEKQQPHEKNELNTFLDTSPKKLYRWQISI